ncbi:hypothetical protein DSO57_1020035 [Entomophthora muscae]|uniref:Uncharacterized protein n=1 Tax=Entomophthora muscae TaxID=34485 RepID=A0ACC2RIG0_9FUNG|nr:hypothetical protein DSO57_1020035 [Entomophthora muscae]
MSFLTWSTSPELWTCIPSSAYLVDKNPSQLLYLLDDLSRKANDLLLTDENLVHSLTCDDVEFALPTAELKSYQDEETQTPALVELEDLSPLVGVPVFPGCALRCTSWLLTSMWLMGLNAYLPQLFSTSTLPL